MASSNTNFAWSRSESVYPIEKYERAHKRARKAGLLCFSFVKAISIVIILKYR